MCDRCRAQYPLLEGLACLAVLNGQWHTPLKEMESRLALAMRLTAPQRWEAGRQEAYDRQEQIVQDTMDYLFRATLAEIDFSGRPLVLDLGAGGCRTSELFMKHGARVIALDADLGQLRYLSFEGLDALPPETWRHPVSGYEFYFKDPRPLKSYLTRVFGNIERLPFPDATFDVVFCRSVLHHLAHHGRTMREMARVLRPGGRMVFCSEPIRSPLECEEDCFDHCVQREEGMNERVWPLWHYLKPVWPLAKDVMVQTWPNPPTRRLTACLPWAARWLSRRIGPGARVRGWQLPALALCNASVNIYATRNRRPVPAEDASPLPFGARERDDLKALAELFRVPPGQMAEGVADLPRKRSVVNSIRRRLLTESGATLPSVIDLADVPLHQLERGWLDVSHVSGRKGRPMGREAACIMAGGLMAGEIAVSATAVGTKPVRLEIWINDQPCGGGDLEPGRFDLIRLRLPDPGEPIQSVRLEARSTAGSGPEQPGGVVVERIAIEPIG